jgi:hypothetical protein
MADAADHPPVPEAVTLPASVPGPEWRASGSLPGLPGPSAGVAPQEAYAPVSLLAIAGFVLAAFYAVLVAVGGLAAFALSRPRTLLLLAALAPLLGALGAHLRRSERIGAIAALALAGVLAGLGVASLLLFAGSAPWLLPLWTLVLPVAAALMSWMARLRIQSSEGALGGIALTGWGLGLSLAFGLYYAAYSAATNFAVREQATTFALDWLELLKKGETQKAFVLTIPPSDRPPEGPTQRGDLELRFNSMPAPTQGGAYTRFGQSDPVRLLAAGADATQIVLRKTKWEFAERAYIVELSYQVTTDLASFELGVTVRGSEASDVRAGGRRWHVDLNNTRLVSQPQQLKPGLVPASASAGRFAMMWLEKLQPTRKGGSPDFAGAYLDTLPPAERARQAKARTKPAFLRGSKRFYAGNLVRAEPDTFWTPRPEKGADVVENRNQFIAGVKKAFDPRAEQRPRLLLQRVRPFPREKGDRLQMRLDIWIEILDSTGAGRPLGFIEGSLLVAGPAKKERSGPWRIEALELIRVMRPPVLPPGRR